MVNLLGATAACSEFLLILWAAVRLVLHLLLLPVRAVPWMYNFIRLNQAIRHIPSPPTSLLGVLGHLPELKRLQQPSPLGYHLESEDQRDLLRQQREAQPLERWINAYAPLLVVRLGPTFPMIVATSPESAKDILGTGGPNKKSDIYKMLHPWLAQGLLTSEKPKWKARRTLLTPSFHFSMLESYVRVFQIHARHMLAHLEGLTRKPQSRFHIYPVFTHVALDIITECATGENVSALANGDSPYVRAVYSQLESTFARLLNPFMWPDAIYWRLTPQGRRAAASLRTLHKHTDRMIARRREILAARQLRQANAETPRSGHPVDHSVDGTAETSELPRAPVADCSTFLDVLLTARDADDSPLDDASIREEVDTFIFEGHDTTSAGMTWATYLIGCHSAVQERVHAELDAVLGDKDVPDIADLSRLQYLTACINEALRCLPPVPFLGRLVDKDISVAGYRVPVGAQVLVPPSVVHHLHTTWAEHWKFQPERFYDGADRPGKRHGTYSFVPFSAGPRGCIGRNFALMEEKCLLASLFKRFKVEVPEDQEVLPSMELIMKPKGGRLEVRLQQRQEVSGAVRDGIAAAAGLPVAS